MSDLTTTYMGLSLPNPLVVASSSLSGSVEGVKRCAEAGAGAVVLKSLFEEQISHETGQLSQYAEYASHYEASQYLQGYGMELGPREYLKLVEDSRKAVDIPVIASLNCFTTERWADYARKLEAAGASAIELNVGLMPNETDQEGTAIEQRYFRILHDVKSRVEIPVAMKVGPYFSSFANFAEKLCRDRAEGPDYTVGWCGPGKSSGEIVWRGADALVLFNRFYQLDIDVEKMKLVAGNPYSTSAEIHTSLRWISLLAGKINCDLAATTGVHNGRDVIKQLLAGAQVVQLCSTLYKNGNEQIGQILEEIRDWMARHQFERLDDFRGRLSQARSSNPRGHERLQYIKLFVGIE